MASCSLPNQLVPQSTISSRSCCCHRKGCFTALLSAGLCSGTIMLQQTIQLVPQHLLQLAAAGRGCPERHTGPSPCWQLWQQAASASQQNMHRGEQVAAQGGPGEQGLLRGRMVDGQSWSHGQGSRFLGWTATTYIKMVFTIKY